MIFHHPQRKIENMIPDLRLNSEPIEKVTDFNFLGLSTDECLSWKAHVQKISNKMSRNIGIVTAIVKTVNTLYRDSNNLSAGGLWDYFVGLEIIPVTWPEC